MASQKNRRPPFAPAQTSIQEFLKSSSKANTCRGKRKQQQKMSSQPTQSSTGKRKREIVVIDDSSSPEKATWFALVCWTVSPVGVPSELMSDAVVYCESSVEETDLKLPSAKVK